MKKLVVIPALNEVKSITRVIAELKKNGYRELLVVDDGSTDGTGEAAARAGAKVCRHLINRGLGAGLGTGFMYARTHGADLLVTFDADGQHRATDLPGLVAPIVSGKVDVVIGSRSLSAKQMPISRKVANLLSNLMTYFFYGVWTGDSQSGLRAFNRKAIERINIKTDRMEVSSEFFKEIRRNGLKFVEVPILAVYTKYSMESSSQEKYAAFVLPFRSLLRLFR